MTKDPLAVKRFLEVNFNAKKIFIKNTYCYKTNAFIATIRIIRFFVYRHGLSTT